MRASSLSIFLLLPLFLFSQSESNSKRHALIIAIGNYPVKNGWSKIESLRDVNIIRNVLQAQQFTNIKTLTDAQATMSGIEVAFKSLEQQVNKGDVVVIHISSHGEQIADNNRDETDGFDESIVTFNAVTPTAYLKGEGSWDELSQRQYNEVQKNYLRDDAFGKLVNRLRRKLGSEGDVVVFIDACHSGSGTRGIANVRGGKPPIKPKGYFPKLNANTKPDEVFQEKDSALLGMASYIVISAAKAEELNAETTDDEGKGIGSLTYAIGKVFQSLDAGVTYRSLFSRIVSVMNMKVPGQHPVIEGNGVDRTLFGGKFEKQQPYFTVEKILNSEVTVKGGMLHGLNVNARVAFAPAGTLQQEKRSTLVLGTVVRSANFSCTVQLDSPVHSAEIKDAWVFIVSPVYNISPIRVQVITRSTNPSASELPLYFSIEEQNRISKALAHLPIIEFKGVPELLLVKGAEEDSIIIAANGYLFTTVKKQHSYFDALETSFKRYAQYKLLQQLSGEQPTIKLKVRLAAVVNGVADTSAKERYTFYEGEAVALVIQNTGPIPVYFNVLDLQPNGNINKLFPNKAADIYPADLKIMPGEVFTLNSKYFIDVTAPYGVERFKIFAAARELDLEHIADTRGATATTNAIENLVQQSYNLATPSSMGGIGKDGSVYDIVFEVKGR